MRKALLGFLIMAAVAVAAPAQLVSMKLTGGVTGINGGDYNQGLAGLNQYLRDTSTGLTGAYEPLRSGLNFQLEIINWFTPNIGLGFGGGYYRLSRTNSLSGQALASGVPYTFDSKLTAKISALPFFLNFRVIVPLAPILSLNVFAGPVFQVVQFNYDNPMTISLNSVVQTETFTASQTSYGGQAGLGLDLNLSRVVSLVAEGCYRFGTVSKLKGNWTLLGTSALGPINQSSSVYDVWFYQLTQGSTYSRFGFFNDNGPAGPGISGARLAEVSLAGLSVSAGVKFSF